MEKYTNDPDDSSWMKYANCKGIDPDLFFPIDGMGVAAAKVVCDNCIVREDCLDYALSNRIDHGIWGGVSERERRRMLRFRRSSQDLPPAQNSPDY